MDALRHLITEGVKESGTCSGCVRQLFWTCSGRLQNMLASCLESIENVLGFRSDVLSAVQVTLRSKRSNLCPRSIPNPLQLPLQTSVPLLLKAQTRHDDYNIGTVVGSYVMAPQSEVPQIT